MSIASVGIDIGGTKIEAVAIERAGELHVLNRTRIPTRAHNGYDALVETVSRFIVEFIKDYPGIHAVGVGMPGSTDGEGRIKNSNTTCLNGRLFRQDVQARVPLLLRFANDANCFALAEAQLGAGKGHDMVFGVIMGTGVGGGLVINGAFRDGPHTICGEWGHTTLWPDHPDRCYCGKRGCVEQFISGPGVENFFESITGMRLPLQRILEKENSGDIAACQSIETLLDNYGRALSNVINILDPDIIVLGGGVSNVPQLYGLGFEKVAQYVFSDICHTPIVQNQLGDSAGVLGAALLSVDS
ncbi:MAG: ROK family protein [Deltaproteobacteria bacterium]|nr:ROK family protein [Deltaproteobacteria bacterium]